MSQFLPDPFSDANGIAFFAGGDRRLLLDEVIHLCQFGNNLVAVLGEQGVGTTSLLSQARYELAETAFCCFITADISKTADNVFAEIVSQLELPVNPSSTAGEMIATLRHSMSEGNMHRVVVVIDDAHHLSDQTLSALASLLQGSQGNHLHLLLGGDKQLVNRLDQFQLVDVLVYDVTLNPLSVEETLDYLNFKMQCAGYPEADGWSHEDAQAIWEESGGYPDRINRVAQTYLFRQDMGEDNTDVESAPGLPLVHMALLVVLLAALIMALFYLGDDEAEIDVAEAPAVVMESQGAPVTESQPEAEQPQVQPQTVEVDGRAVAEAPALSDSPQQLSAVATNEPPKEKTLPSEQPVQTIAKQPAVTESVDPKTADQSPVSAVPVRSPEKAVDTTAPTQRQLTADEQKVLAWPDESYSLQVMAAAQKQSLQNFVSQQPNRVELRLITVERNGQPWYIVLTGVYSDSNSARQAIRLLPQSQVNAGPWPRKIAEIKREMTEVSRN